MALREAAEAYLVSLFEDTNLAMPSESRFSQRILLSPADWGVSDHRVSFKLFWGLNCITCSVFYYSFLSSLFPSIRPVAIYVAYIKNFLRSGSEASSCPKTWLCVCSFASRRLGRFARQLLQFDDSASSSSGGSSFDLNIWHSAFKRVNKFLGTFLFFFACGGPCHHFPHLGLGHWHVIPCN